MEADDRIADLLAGVMNMIMSYGKRRLVTVDGVTLFPSEAHVLVHALAGMTFTEIAQRLAISTSAVSQSIARLSQKGVVTVQKDRQRKNAAVVRLTPLGSRIVPHITSVGRRLDTELQGMLSRYPPTQLDVIEQFLTDIHQVVRSSLACSPTEPSGGLDRSTDDAAPS